MLSDAFAGSDPNLTVKTFLRKDGHQLFMEQLQKLYSEKLAELFGGQSL